MSKYGDISGPYFPAFGLKKSLIKKFIFWAVLGPAIIRGNTVSFELAEKNISEQNFSNQRNWEKK